MAEAARRAFGRFDDAVEARVERLRGNRVLDRVMYTASALGEGSLIWHLLGLLLVPLAGHTFHSSLRLSTILVVESVVVNLGIKQLFRRRRPEWTADQARPHRLRSPRSSSFPSGHASAAFTAAGVLSAGGDHLWPVYYALAVVVAGSRPYVRIHHGSDVVAGALLGVGLAIVANHIWLP
jgi:membrane-associated phospholipid phosphatase